MDGKMESKKQYICPTQTNFAGAIKQQTQIIDLKHADPCTTKPKHEAIHSELLGQFRESDLVCITLDFMMT